MYHVGTPSVMIFSSLIHFFNKQMAGYYAKIKSKSDLIFWLDGWSMRKLAVPIYELAFQSMTLNGTSNKKSYIIFIYFCQKHQLLSTLSLNDIQFHSSISIWQAYFESTLFSGGIATHKFIHLRYLLLVFNMSLMAWLKNCFMAYSGLWVCFTSCVFSTAWLHRCCQFIWQCYYFRYMDWSGGDNNLLLNPFRMLMSGGVVVLLIGSVFAYKKQYTRNNETEPF